MDIVTLPLQLYALGAGDAQRDQLLRRHKCLRVRWREGVSLSLLRSLIKMRLMPRLWRLLTSSTTTSSSVIAGKVAKGLAAVPPQLDAQDVVDSQPVQLQRRHQLVPVGLLRGG